MFVLVGLMFLFGRYICDHWLTTPTDCHGKLKKYPEKYICLETGHYMSMLAEDR